MFARSYRLGLALLLTLLAVLPIAVRGQEKDEPPPVPKGIEVLARGPVHEAFASLTGEPIPTRPAPKQPPKPLEELPPAEKPEGNVVWIGGYWAWDDERKDFLWVSGVWRTPPPGKQWIAGYWREAGEQWQWVPGFWTAATAEQEAKEVAYLPQPPEPPQVAPPGQAPVADAFFVSGVWLWNPERGSYAWRAGYWARVQPGYVWVPDHYRWTPAGFLFIPGYWDLAVSRRGVLYAPVVIDPVVVTTGFTYTPAYAVSDTVVVDALFVRPAYGHYYFGDYYGPTYTTLGYESVFVYGGRRYDSIVVYETWAHRSQPNWVSIQIDVFNGRSRGVLPTPPRTLVQQNTIIQQNITNVTNVTKVTNNITNVTRTTNYNTTVLAPTSKIVAAKGVKTVPLDAATRTQARQQAATLQQVATQRTAVEKPLPPGAPRQARVAALSVPSARPVQSGFVAPRVSPQAAAVARNAAPPRPAVTAPRTFSPPAAPGHPAGVASVPPVPPRGPAPGHPAITPAAAHTGMNPALPHAPTTAPRGTPGIGARPAARPPTPPARRPPPKDNREHRG